MKPIARFTVINNTYRRIFIAPTLRYTGVMPVHATLLERVEVGDPMADYRDIITPLRLIRPIEINGDAWKRYSTTTHPVLASDLFPRMGKQDTEFVSALVYSLFYAHVRLKNVKYYELQPDVLCCRWITEHADYKDLYEGGSIYAVNANTGRPLDTAGKNTVTDWSEDMLTQLFKRGLWSRKTKTHLCDDNEY